MDTFEMEMVGGETLLFVLFNSFMPGFYSRFLLL